MRIQPPINCPSCNYPLEWINDNLYCKNPNCVATAQKLVEHFAKTLKIRGLGPASIEKLEINSIQEIYEIDIPYITVCLGSVKLAVKLFDEINKSKQEPLNTVLPAFGISLIGKSATDKLSIVCDSIFDIDEQICRSAGLGPKATENLMNWLIEDFENYVHLPFSFKFDKEPSGNKGVICISGKLSSFKTKKEAAKVLKLLGYVVKDSMTKDVTILVNESSRETDKTRKARESGVTIINNLKTFIEEN